MISEPLSASRRSSEQLSLPVLQSKMKSDPEGYETELSLIYNQFNSAIDLFQQQAALNSLASPADATISKDLGDRALFLAHVFPFYLAQLSSFPRALLDFLESSARNLPSGLRVHITQALILMVNRKMVDIGDTLKLFTVLQTLGDRTLKKLVFSHVLQSIRRMNMKHRNEAKNRTLQTVLFKLLEVGNEAEAKRSLVTLCELHRRKVWFDSRTADAICKACFHSAPRIMIAALSFLLDYEKIYDNDSESDDDDDSNAQTPEVILNKETIYKANHKGTLASKKKKKAKLQRVIKSMRKKQRSSDCSNPNSYSPLNHLKDAQGFVEKLFSRLQTCNERFEVRMMMLKVIARTIGLHRLFLLNFYPFLQKYVQPHLQDITSLLASAIEACHDMIPPDAVEPLFRQLVNQFVHDRSRPEIIAVGLNAVRELCLRMPLLMTEDLLQDLVLYKKSHEKAVSCAARSLMTLFREVCPSLLVKKDRGRPVDPKAKPKAYGEVEVATNVPGLELLRESADASEDDESNDDEDGKEDNDDEDDGDESGDGVGMMDDDAEDNELIENESDEEEAGCSDECESDGHDGADSDEDNCSTSDDDDSNPEDRGKNGGPLDNNDGHLTKAKAPKRKLADFNKRLLTADSSLRSLKRLATEQMKESTSDAADGILSNEDFERIREMKERNNANSTLSRHGFKIPNSDQLSAKPMDPRKLEVHVRRKMSKDERLQMVKAGREDREKYQSRTAVKQKKTGGKSNRQKDHNKKMPLAAKRQKIVRSRKEKAFKSRSSSKQFRGKKAWE